ncbi:uncharacterized protein LOC103160225 [Cricetulus griseus]|uniref:uncharacterized protein LOC103160225 n=1 Tax=Cricetulus griseus TaxID=10029 RepID=UPI0015C3D26A|nr:uncharacterized protein LOC103160225 [Cricetulus griseus]
MRSSTWQRTCETKNHCHLLKDGETLMTSGFFIAFQANGESPDPPSDNGIAFSPATVFTSSHRCSALPTVHTNNLKEGLGFGPVDLLHSLSSGDQIQVLRLIDRSLYLLRCLALTLNPYLPTSARITGMFHKAQKHLMLQNILIDTIIVSVYGL